jgi:hypothetical protein
VRKNRDVANVIKNGLAPSGETLGSCCRGMGGDDTLWREPLHANANNDADARDPYLVSRFKLVSAQDCTLYRMDPHVVVLCPSALGRCFVGSSSQGAGVDLHSCASGLRFVVLDTRGNGDRGVGAVRVLSQQ